MVELKNVTKKYGEKVVFKNFNISFSSGKVSAILGNSGVGKTTLLNIVSGLTDYEGQVVNDSDVSFVFQSPRLIPFLTVKENVTYVLSGIIKDAKERERIALEKLKLCEIEHLKDKLPNKISGGEAQRVQLARALAYEGKLIIMDEPFSSLDIALKGRLMRLYADLLQNNEYTVLFVTHDPFEALSLADDIFILKDGSYEKLSISLPRKDRNLEDGEVAKVREAIYSSLLK